MPDVLLQIGSKPLTLHFADGQLVQARRAHAPTPLVDIRQATAASLEAPIEFPALRLALTPDDHLTILVDEDFNGLAEVVESVLRHIQSAGVQMDQITILVHTRQPHEKHDWLERLPPDCQGFKLEEHLPEESKMAYLASTKAGRRIYLNRHIVDADQLIIIGTAKFDPVHGVASGLADLFPAFSDMPTRLELTRHLHNTVPKVDHPFPIWKETEEVGWQLGLPFVVCIMEGTGEDVYQIISGSAFHVRQKAEAVLRQNNVVQIPYQVDLVIGTLVGSSGQQTLAQVTEAFFRASRAVHQGGQVAILSDAGGLLPPGADIVSQAETVVAGLTFLREFPQVDRQPWWYLAQALEHSKVYLSSHFQQEVVESLFVVPLDEPRLVQNLITGAPHVLVVEGIDRCHLEWAKAVGK